MTDPSPFASTGAPVDAGHTVEVAARRGERIVRVVESIALGVAGVAVLLTARLRWISEGVGSTLDGFELAHSLRNGALVPDAGGWVAAGLYLLVALGGLLLASSGFDGRLVAALRLTTSLIVAISLAIAALAGWFPMARWSFGPTLVLVACVIAVVVSCGQLLPGRIGVSHDSR